MRFLQLCEKISHLNASVRFFHFQLIFVMVAKNFKSLKPHRAIFAYFLAKY